MHTRDVNKATTGCSSRVRRRLRFHGATSLLGSAFTLVTDVGAETYDGAGAKGRKIYIFSAVFLENDRNRFPLFFPKQQKKIKVLVKINSAVFQKQRRKKSKKSAVFN